MRQVRLILEIVGLLVATGLASCWVLASTGLDAQLQALPRTDDTAFPWLATAVATTLKWGLALGLAHAGRRARERATLRADGFTLAGRPLGVHLKVGLLTTAVGFLPVAALLQLRHALGLEGGPAAWALFDTATRDADFWAFMLAGSILLPPLFEEAYFRGYAVSRLQPGFGPRWAVAVVAVIFSLAHLQYLDGSLVGTGMALLLLWESVAFGFARLTSGSLIAPVLAHGLANVPLTPFQRSMEIVLLLALLLWGYSRERPLLRSLLTGTPAPS